MRGDARADSSLLCSFTLKKKKKFLFAVVLFNSSRPRLARHTRVRARRERDETVDRRNRGPGRSVDVEIREERLRRGTTRAPMRTGVVPPSHYIGGTIHGPRIRPPPARAAGGASRGRPDAVRRPTGLSARRRGRARERDSRRRCAPRRGAAPPRLAAGASCVEINQWFGRSNTRALKSG